MTSTPLDLALDALQAHDRGVPVDLEKLRTGFAAASIELERAIGADEVARDRQWAALKYAEAARLLGSFVDALDEQDRWAALIAVGRSIGAPSFAPPLDHVPADWADGA